MRNIDNIAILGGSGEILTLSIKIALKKNLVPVVIKFKEVERYPSFKNFSNKIKLYDVEIGRIGKVIKILKKEGIKNILFIGKIEKTTVLYKTRFDLTALKLLKSLIDKSDSSIMESLVSFLESYGFKIIPQNVFLKEFVANRGIITGKKLTKSEEEEIKYGYKIAKKVAELGIGQSIIVSNKIVIGVEGVEGTDNLIKRCGKYIKKKGILVKVAKRGHNPKYDLPGVGINTLRLMKRNNLNILAIESGKTLIVNKEKFINFARKNRIKVIGL